MLNDIRIWDINDNEINLSNYGLTGLDLTPESPSYTVQTETIEGMDGAIALGKQLNPRNLTARFLVKSFDYTDSLIKRDEIYNLFNGTEPFYIAETKLPYKRWLVESVEPWTPERYNPTTMEITLNLICWKGRPESIGTSIQAKTFEHLQELPVTYTDYQDIYATKFKIYNPGQLIDPRNPNHYLKITYKGNSENLRIENKTTGDVWQYLGTSNLNDEIVIEGIRSTKNGLSIFRDTNKRLISIAPGWNEFEISGAPDTREYAIQANMPRKKIPAELKKNPLTFEFKFIF